MRCYNGIEHLYDVTINIFDEEYNKNSKLNLGENIIFHINGGKKVKSEILYIDQNNDTEVLITVNVNDEYYDDFLNAGKNDWYDISLEETKFDDFDILHWEVV